MAPEDAQPVEIHLEKTGPARRDAPSAGTKPAPGALPRPLQRGESSAASATSQVSKRTRPRTFRELLADSCADLESKGRGSRAEADEMEALMREHRIRGHRESPAEVIEKKRELFLLQYSLDAKKAEIQRLREAAAREEDSLKKAETALEQSAVDFDRFLEENDRKAMEALRKAEQETRLKLAKTKEIKKLQLSLIAVRSEISKSEEQLRDSLRCRKLLEMLTPKEWLEEHVYRPRKLRKAERERIAAEALAAAAAEGSNQGRENGPNLRSTIRKIARGLRQVRIASSGAQPGAGGVSGGGKVKAGQPTKAPSRRGSISTRRRSSAALATPKGQSTASLADKKSAENVPILPESDDPLAEISIDDPDSFDLEGVLAKLQDLEGDADVPTYFTEPSQLLHEFAKMDKRNAELEQECKDEEARVAELQIRLRAESEKAEKEKQDRQGEIDALNAEIAKQREMLSAAQKQHNILLANLAEDQEQILDELNRKVSELYLACCPVQGTFAFRDDALSAAEMLTAVMQQLTKMLDQLDKTEPGILKAAKEILVRERGRQRAGRFGK
ncbi:hypothetical protein DFJ74DRAFT_754747 [Hyaloraphidium curvatum]|nr:hypothetical protein DFJ74DRAFT_754747 [Hyaloraphidium curvatum]